MVDLDRVIGTFGLHTNVIRDELNKDAHAIVDARSGAARDRGSLRTVWSLRDGGRCRDDEAVKRHADLVIVGSHGRHGLQRFFLGSVAESIVRQAAVPVLVVRQ